MKIIDEGRIFWVKGEEGKEEGKEGEEGEGERVQLIYYMLKIIFLKKDNWKGSNTMGEGVSFASK